MRARAAAQVNTASRMESHGVPGCLQLSAAARDELLREGASQDAFESFGERAIKGKGLMRTFLAKARHAPRISHPHRASRQLRDDIPRSQASPRTAHPEEAGLWTQGAPFEGPRSVPARGCGAGGRVGDGGARGDRAGGGGGAARGGGAGGGRRGGRCGSGARVRRRRKRRAGDLVRHDLQRFIKLGILAGRGFAASAPAEGGAIAMYSPAFYAACTVGGIASCGLTHTLVTPLDIVKCNMQVRPAGCRLAACRRGSC